MIQRPFHWYTPGAHCVFTVCHPGGFGSAVDPYVCPVVVCHPPFGLVDTSTPMWLPHVDPVAYRYHWLPTRTRSGSGALWFHTLPWPDSGRGVGVDAPPNGHTVSRSTPVPSAPDPPSSTMRVAPRRNSSSFTVFGTQFVRVSRIGPGASAAAGPPASASAYPAPDARYAVDDFVNARVDAARDVSYRSAPATRVTSLTIDRSCDSAPAPTDA